MFTVLSILLAGIAAGWLLRRRPAVKTVAGGLVMPVICLLLLAMGAGIGANGQVMSHLPTLGLQAAVITAGALGGSMLAAWFVYIRFFRKRNEK